MSASAEPLSLHEAPGAPSFVPYRREGRNPHKGTGVKVLRAVMGT